MRAIDHTVETQYRFESGFLITIQLFNPYIDQANRALRLELPLYQSAQVQGLSEGRGHSTEASDRRLGVLWPNQQRGAIGLSHAFGHALGATYSIPHGITSYLTLDRTVALLATTLPPYEKACLARGADFIPRHFNSDGLSTSATIGDASISEDDSDEGLTRKALIVSKAVQQLVKELGLASTLGEYGVPQGDFEKIAQEVASAIENTPGAPSSGKLLEEILRKGT
ncbi:hypothetical protein FRB94_001410 [Tulasnella sp. JGI-2019a]|nr:hypothetical protein FRB94_001410 [Tulasnella sp. JGI-2019a]KAG8993233.1 hypothetical protein FRB93_002070 [Tulasnella sp. JGI-2019a]KAG9023431.1 hypothetical protein FRB95_013119 [Tulasnella sp. JGI-2019a]